MKNNNLLTNIPNNLEEEIFESIFKNQRIKIERIISHGHASPADQWYDQVHDEWVLILQGEAFLTFFGNDPIQLSKGDHLFIPAHQRHRVQSTLSNEVTIWLAIHIYE